MEVRIHCTGLRVIQIRSSDHGLEPKQSLLTTFIFIPHISVTAYASQGRAVHRALRFLDFFFDFVAFLPFLLFAKLPSSLLGELSGALERTAIVIWY